MRSNTMGQGFSNIDLRLNDGFVRTTDLSARKFGCPQWVKTESITKCHAEPVEGRPVAINELGKNQDC